MIKNCNVYEMITPTKIFFLERLENCLPGESNDVAKELKSKEATIEHIMPQSLNESWKKMLGENFGSNRSPGGFEKNYTYQIGTQLKAFKSGYQKET